MLGSFPAELPQDPCLRLYIAYNYTTLWQLCDIRIEWCRHLLLFVDGYEQVSVSYWSMFLNWQWHPDNTNYKSHPCINISFWNYIFRREIRERFAKGPRKVRERRILPDPTLAQNGQVHSAASQLQKLFKKMVQNQCAEVKLPHRNTDLPNTINSVNLLRNMRTKTWSYSLSPFCWGAKGSRKGGVRAVLEYHNFEHLQFGLDTVNHLRLKTAEEFWGHTEIMWELCVIVIS